MDNRKLTSADNSRRHSTGPKTEEGKRRSSRNSFKHGAYAQSLRLLPDEDTAIVESLIQHHADMYQPEGPVEVSFVRQMGAALHRLERLAPAEACIVSAQMQRMRIVVNAEFKQASPEGLFALAFAQLIAKNEGVLHLSREERRLLRHYDHLRNSLLDAQSRRPPALDGPGDGPGDAPECANDETVSTAQTKETKANAVNQTINDGTNLTTPMAIHVTDPHAGIWWILPPIPNPFTDQERSNSSY